MPARNRKTPAKPAAPAKIAAPRAPAPPVVVTAPEDGLYCCGQRHPARPVAYPLGWFSVRQLDQLRAAGCTVEHT